MLPVSDAESRLRCQMANYVAGICLLRVLPTMFRWREENGARGADERQPSVVRPFEAEALYSGEI